MNKDIYIEVLKNKVLTLTDENLILNSLLIEYKQYIEKLEKEKEENIETFDCEDIEIVDEKGIGESK